MGGAGDESSNSGAVGDRPDEIPKRPK